MLQAPQVNGKPQAQGKDDEVAIQRLLKQAEMVCIPLILLRHTAQYPCLITHVHVGATNQAE